jgi:tRNA pseudouridine38-40 synthase
VPAFRITVAYDGTGFVGWQRQPGGPSVQGLLEDALGELEGGPVDLTGAGRTDAGVHALGQTASFTLTKSFDTGAVQRALNARLPGTVRVVEARTAPDGFHARFDARRKAYRYQIWNGDVASPFVRRFAWHVPGPLDVASMAAGARLLEGRHDFAGFQSAGSDVATTERTIFHSDVRLAADDAFGDGVPGRLVVYDVTGDGFLRHMVRAIVGSLVDVGRGRRRPAWVSEIVGSKRRDAAGRTAPAHGLCLVRVEYAQDGAKVRMASTDGLRAGQIPVE